MLRSLAAPSSIKANGSLSSARASAGKQRKQATTIEPYARVRRIATTLIRLSWRPPRFKHIHDIGRDAAPACTRAIRRRLILSLIKYHRRSEEKSRLPDREGA